MLGLFWIVVLYYGGYLVYHAVRFMGYCPKVFSHRFKVSIIIPVRNEASVIADCLQSVLNQRYPSSLMEVIIVNDHSEDSTMEMVKAYALKYENVRFLELEKGKIGKKAAISLGIERSSGEIILTTDADTYRGPEWVQTMVSYFSEEVAMVSGPVRLTGDTIIQKMQALEFAGLVVLGAGMIANRRPSLCNGANLAYRKKVFLEVKGFEKVDHIASGDDELLLHKIRRLGKYSIVFAKSPKAIVETPAHKNIRNFLQQRLRWASKSTVYPDAWITFHLIMAYLSNFAILVSFIMMVLGFQVKGLCLGLSLLKVSAEFFILRVATRFLEQKHLLRWLWVEQFVHIPYVLWVGLASVLKVRYQWKGRIVK